MSNSIIISQGNCLILMIGPSGSGKSTMAADLFYPFEIISPDNLRLELTYDFKRQDKNEEVFIEVRRRLETRLKLGLRAMIDATNLSFKERKPFVELANQFNCDIFYIVVNRPLIEKEATAGWRENVMNENGVSLIVRHEEKFVNNEVNILNGDNIAGIRVIDTRVDAVKAIDMKKYHPDYTELLKEYNTVRIIADVHGNIDGLNQVLDAPEGTFFIFLGDIVDYGDNIIECLDKVYDLVNRGRALSVRGNHEKKIAVLIKYHKEHGDFGKKQVSTGVKATFDQVWTLDKDASDRWFSNALAFENLCPDYIRFANVLLTHGACHPDMWKNNSFRLFQGSKAESFAMYGQTTGEFIDGYPVRIYDWVDLIPPDHKVIVGHDIRSKEAPLTYKGALGGEVTFLDTGSSKGGKLSWIDGFIDESNKFVVKGMESV